MSATRNRKYKDRKRRVQLRAKLRAEGVNESLIDKIIEQRMHEDRIARVGLEQARKHASDEAHSSDLDDSGFKPSAGDPLLRGEARAQGVTAKVVRRRDTITEFEYDRKVNRG